MMVSMQIKKPNGGWGYKAESRKPICRKMATAFQSSSRVGGGLGHLLECLSLPPFLDITRVLRRRIVLSGTTVQSEMVTNWCFRNSSQSSLMNVF